MIRYVQKVSNSVLPVFLQYWTLDAGMMNDHQKHRPLHLTCISKTPKPPRRGLGLRSPGATTFFRDLADARLRGGFHADVAGNRSEGNVRGVGSKRMSNLERA